MGDDGVGVAVVRRLRREALDPRVELVEAGTSVMDALDVVAPGADVLVVDAASGGHPPGSVYRFALENLASLGSHLHFARGGLVPNEDVTPLSLHETSLPEAFTLARLAGAKFGTVVVIGVEPARVAPGVALSPTLEERMPAILDAVRSEIARLLT